MKKIFFLLYLLGIFAATPILAQEAVSAKENSAAVQKGNTTILNKIRKLKPKFAKLPKSAEYLIVCKFSAKDDSAGEMLVVLSKQKDALKKADIALLLLCEDKSVKEAAALMKKKKVKLPTVFTSKVKDISPYLPEISHDVTILDMDGKTVSSGNASLADNLPDEVSRVQEEQQLRLADAQEEAKRQAALKEWATLEVNADEYPVAAALKGITTSPTHGTFDTKADYYIYFYSASWCGLCEKIMPQVKEAYREMQRTNQPKVEIILLGVDKTAEEVAAYRKEQKLPFYTVFARDKEVQMIPGFYSVSGIPFCVFVDKHGNQFHSELGGEAILNWKKTIEKAETP